MTDINEYNGVVADPRTPEAKAKDYLQEEVVMAVPLKWNRGIKDAPTYSVRDQDGSGSCVAQATAKALEILTGTVQSAHPIYRRRMNYPGMGMYLQDAFSIVKNLGTTTEALDRSQEMSEVEMNADVTIPTPLSGFTYAFPNVKNIDSVALAIETQKECPITINGTIQEYANSEKPVVTPGTLNCAHAICGMYYFTDENGVKCILIEESWGPNHIRKRVLTEDYLKARGTAAGYLIPPVIAPNPVKPKFTFQTPLLYGQKNYSIKMLQDILKYENLMNHNIDSTGYYWEATRKSVLAWQIKHQVASQSELEALQGKRVGLKTITKLNEIYDR